VLIRISTGKVVPLALVLLGCAGLSTIAASAANPCDTVEAPAQLFDRAGMMIGELHGTREAPAFVGRVACQAAARSAVTIALEYPRQQQAALDAFMREQDAAQARAQLLRSTFWKNHDSDGRASLGLLTLLQSVRGWKRQGLPLNVVAFDIAAEAPAAARETRNAEFLGELLADAKRGFLIVLAGHIHARKVTGLPWDDSFEPLGYLLRDRNLLHLNMAWDGGSAWFCKSDDPEDEKAVPVCGAHALKEKPPAASTLFSIVLGQQSPEYDGVFYVGTTTASPPASQAAAASSPSRERTP